MSRVDLTVMGKQPPEPGGLRLVFTLAVAGIVSGLLLASAYVSTRPTILANQQRALQRAVFEVVPGSTSLRPLVEHDGRLGVVEAGASAPDAEVFAAYADDGTFRGYAIAAEGPGFQDTIRLLFGYDPAGKRVTGMYVLESRETPGLGDRIYKDPDFRANFNDLATTPKIELVKGGRTKDNQIDAITGATISSRSVVGIVNRALERIVPMLPEPPPPGPAKEGGDG